MAGGKWRICWATICQSGWSRRLWRWPTFRPSGAVQNSRTQSGQSSSSGSRRGFDKAEVTAGGVALDEVNSRDMQSKLVPNLYLAGEILDLDGFIGGYNFQAAFSTGYLAGDSV
jgi:hypothetical protein